MQSPWIIHGVCSRGRNNAVSLDALTFDLLMVSMIENGRTVIGLSQHVSEELALER